MNRKWYILMVLLIIATAWSHEVEAITFANARNLEPVTEAYDMDLFLTPGSLAAALA